MEDVLALSVVIPNYNGTSLLKKYLPSVLDCLDSGDEVIIVDDNSTDESVKYLINHYGLELTKKTKLPTQVSQNYTPQPKELGHKLYITTLTHKNKKITLQLVALEKNVRFAACVNYGVLFVKNTHFLLLNTDVKPTANLKQHLLAHFSDKNVFAVGCLEYEKNESGEKSGKNKLWFQKGMFLHSKASDMKTGETAWVSGGSGVFDTKKWVALNGFDPAFYPAYWEDVDLSFRARKKGWKVLFEEKAVVFHIHESTNKDAFGEQKIDDMSWKNSITFVKKHANFWQKILYYIYTPYWQYKRNYVR